MSAYTTIKITRSKALRTMLEHLMLAPSDSELEDFMDSLLRERLYNVQIVADDCDNDDGIV